MGRIRDIIISAVVGGAIVLAGQQVGNSSFDCTPIEIHLADSHEKGTTCTDGRFIITWREGETPTHAFDTETGNFVPISQAR